MQQLWTHHPDVSLCWKRCDGICSAVRAGLVQAPRRGVRDSCVCMCLQGTKLLFYDSKADVLLLDIPDSIPDHFHAYKVGFDAAEEVPNRAVAIHHPAGNIKRISYANDSCAHPALGACG